MRIRTAMVTLAATGLVGGGLLAAPAQASPSAKWIPAPLSTLESVVKSINASAKANKEPRHSPGCFSALSLSGNRNFLAVSLQPKANVDACGSPTDFGVQAYRKSGSKWLHVVGISWTGRHLVRVHEGHDRLGQATSEVVGDVPISPSRFHA